MPPDGASFQEEGIEMRSVDLCVTERASLVLLCLVMKRWRAGNGGIDGERVALQAHGVYLAAREQAWIGRAVWCVAGHAALDLHGLVFEYKGAGLIGVTSEANGVLGGRRTQLRCHEAAVLVVTVGTFHQAFVDAVVKRLAELRPHVLMTSVAKPRLAIHEQELRLFGMVR